MNNDEQTHDELKRRVVELEKAVPDPAAVELWATIGVMPGETEEDVMARYLANHPAEPPPNHWVVLQGVAPNHQGTS